MVNKLRLGVYSLLYRPGWGSAHDGHKKTPFVSRHAGRCQGVGTLQCIMPRVTTAWPGKPSNGVKLMVRKCGMVIIQLL